jgi:hypothetical protein
MRSFASIVLVVAAACGKPGAKPDAAPNPPDDAPIDMFVPDAPIDMMPPIDGNPLEPDTLAGTGLCLDAACTMISPDVHEYEPQYVLWADTATKRRWIFIPPGTQIDTSDMNHWVFPAGTKIWKEFTRDGIRIETRYIAKLTDSAEDPTDVGTPWFYITYQWNSDAGNPLGDSTTAVTSGVVNANGTGHDIPSRNACKGCHERLKPGRVLGFSAMSLDFHQTKPGLLDLDGAIAAGLLSAPPAGATSPHFPFPADATAADIAAAGYVHVNCSHCHNASSDIFANITPIDFRLDVDKLDTRTSFNLFGRIGQTAQGITDAADPNGNCHPLTNPVNADGDLGAGDLIGCKQVLVAPWAGTTDYAIGDRRTNNGNAYICPLAGTSAATGGPTTTDDLVVDGTAHWAFIGQRRTRSVMMFRYETANLGQHMPAAGTEMTDPDGDATLKTWVDQLP